ncbi:unnamed protein product [Rotaria sp. Silwood1]|nr:unnamed protein product [Rotaria sp. Silwood1]CAF3384380.1 unnamed protein product [Rotaria sp. Silwood1]CAF4886855.1 unnamed protein product [Rotaria sp. Silwood1]
MAASDEPQIYKKRYKIDEKLGAGNFGTAYLVTDLKAKHEPKVLKVVRLGEMDEEQTIDSVNEAQLLKSLQNEHIVKFYESFLENDCLCIVTEYCEGGDLDHRLKELKKQNRKLEEDQVVEWLIQILIAVQYMHKSRVLHRDLKARNIFLKSNNIKIGDFGISRILVGTMDVATTFTGTPYYMSPEVLKHDGYESKSDIWSVGCLLYEMCTWEHAFGGKGLMNVIYKVVEGKAPELPTTYSKELNDVLKKMLIKDPKKRPTATDLLKTPFIVKHRQRTHLDGPLEDTISGNLRLREINANTQTPINYRQMKNTSWSISSKDHIPDDYDDAESGNISSNKPNEVSEEEEEQTLKNSNTIKPAKQITAERKLHETNAHGQLFNQAIRSNVTETIQNRQMMRENKSSGTMKQSQPLADNSEENGQIFNNRARNSTQLSNEGKFNNRTGARNTSFGGNTEDRPITPMRGTYKQLAEGFDEGDSKYYNNQFNDHSPTRERETNETTSKTRRAMSGSQRSTMNSLSQTMGPNHPANFNKERKSKSPSRTIGSATRQKTSLNLPIDDTSATLRDDPTKDAFGRFAKDAKINALRTKAIQLLGESTFEKVYDYLVQQRTAQKTNPNFDEAQITEGLKAFVKKPADCFLVDQLVFLEL